MKQGQENNMTEPSVIRDRLSYAEPESSTEQQATVVRRATLIGSSVRQLKNKKVKECKDTLKKKKNEECRAFDLTDKYTALRSDLRKLSTVVINLDKNLVVNLSNNMHIISILS